MKKHVRELEPIPRFYGVAYRSFTFRGSVCYPIPLNYLVRWYIDIVTRLKCPPIERWFADEIQAAYARGYESGKRAGRETYRAEMLAGLAAIQRPRE